MKMMLFLRMAWRRKAHCLLVVLFILAATVFLLLYPGFMEGTRQELEYAYDTIEVSGWLINAEGYGEPLIPGDVWHETAASGYLAEHEVYSRVEAVLPDNIGGSYVKLEENLHRKMERDPERVLWSRFCGVSSMNAEPEIGRQAPEIQWAEGYSEVSFITTGENLCILPEYFGISPGESVPVMFKAVFPHPGAAEYTVEQFIVAGTYPRSTGVDTIGYCPIDSIETMAQQQNWRFYVNNFVFTVENNRDLPALKGLFRTMGLGVNGETGIRAAIDDRILDGTISPIQSNLSMLEGLYHFFFVLIVAIGFFLCFLLAKNRKAEYAVMRMLGESSLQVTFKALLEQFVLCLAGILLGVLILLLTGQGSTEPATCGIILVCYTIGAAIAVLLTVRVNVMEILLDKE